MKTRLHRWCQKHGANDRQATSLTDSVFAKYSEAHRHYNHLEHIRREDQPIPKKDFKRGRAAILENILAGKVYQSSEFQHLEASVRQNLAQELADLTASGE